MKRFYLPLTAALAVAACNNNMPMPDESAGLLLSCDAPSTVSILVFDKTVDGQVCVRKTKTKIQTCRKHRDDQACVCPGDTLEWKWKKNDDGSSGNDIDRPFKITMKAGFNSPFETSPACDGMDNTVSCVIDSETPRGTFYEYNVVVDTSENPLPECNLDPRFLIY